MATASSLNAAATDSKPPLISVRSSEGMFLLSSFQSKYSQLDKFFHEDSKNCRISAFDPTGKYFAYCNSVQVKVYALEGTTESRLVATIDKPRTSYLKFSPLGSYLILWETFYVTKDEKKDVMNLCVYETSTGSLVKSQVEKKFQENFVQWSKDEMTAAIVHSNEIYFYENKNFGVISRRIKLDNLTSFSMSPVSRCVAIHSAGKKNEPSSIRLYQYPNTETVVANKSFFNSDRVEFKWNKPGNNLLLLCSTEMSASSYYGDTTLHQIDIKGESQLVQLSKKGPIYAQEWNPVKDEFIVVYGTMPAKATLFNAKCVALYDFGTGPRNEIYFSPHGNVVCLAGFGNLAGRVEVWNLSANNRVPQELGVIQADDTTYFEWSADGEHILTATTAPRLRVSNGYKIWNYSGENFYTYKLPQGGELWQVGWQPGVFAPKPVVKKTAAVVQPETKAYVPPHLRGTNRVPDFKSKLHEDDEKPDKNLKVKPADGEDPEKKLKNLKKKLQQIDELRKKQAAGEKLEKNQLDKIKAESEILAEIKKLNI